jgi:flagellin
MSLSILNSVSSLVAENSLARSSLGQQKALQELSTGLKINSSADDAAGLAISAGLQANTTALAQSYANANNGISFLQVADGALAQVNSLLNRAVTLATESASGNLTGQQRTATNAEYQSILTEINQIGATTQFNGSQVFTNGNSSPVALANNVSTITGNVNPADTLSGGFDVTSTIPAFAGDTTGITLNDSGGTSTTGTITPSSTLSGSITVTSKTSGVEGSANPITFTASGNGSTITSSRIVAGDTLSGSLVINSSGGNASDSDTIDLANYQNLASSVGATATAAAHQLATDMTTAMQGTTGSTYTASISGGVLTIQTSNPVTAPSPASVSFSPDLWDLTGSGFDLGATLAGSLTFTSSGGNAGGSATIDFANYQGLTSSNLATQNAALTQLGSNLTASLGSATGSTYTAMFASDGQLFIMSGNVNERYEVSDSNVTATPVLGTQNVTLTDQDGFQLYTNPIAPGSTVSGMLNIDATGPDGSATASIDLGNSSYSGLFSNGPDSFNAAMNLQNTLNTDLAAATGNEFSYQVMPFGNGTLNIQNMGGPESTLSGTFSTIQATLSGGESLSIGNGSNGVQTTGNSDSLTFATSNGGSTITSSQIVAGDTLSGSLVINSSGGNASDSDTIDLANYQNLASSVGATATAAAHQLATDMTTAMQGTTGSTYTASISGGVLTIQTSNPVTAPSPASVSFSPDLWDLTGSGFDLGATLAGSLTFTSSGGNAGGSATIDFANYQGLTSSNLATQNAALTQLGSNLTASLGSATGSTYTAMFASDGQLFIMSGNVNERYEVSDSNVTATPVLGTQNVTLTDQDGFQLYTNPIAPGSTVSGMLNIDATGPDGSATASIDLGNSSYSGLFSNGPDSFNAAMNLQNTLNTDLAAATGNEFSYQVMPFGNGTLNIQNMGGPESTLSGTFSTIQATLSGGESLSIGNGSNGIQTTGSSGVSVPTIISLAGQSTAGLQAFLQAQLGTNDYTVNYNNSNGSLSILLKNGNPDGYTSFSTSSSASQDVGYVAPITATTPLSLASLTKTTLASSLLTQLGGNYTVSYDQTSGALSIGISATGTSAGITSIATNNNTAVETAPAGTTGLSAVDIFTGDGTVSGSTRLDVTVGSLTTANLGTSNGSTGADLSGNDLLSQSGATASLTMINTAITDISSQRGAVGANINRLAATASDIGTEQINLTSATNSILNADIGKTVANMTQYNILQSTGMASLQQANQAQQAVLKLLQ